MRLPLVLLFTLVLSGAAQAQTSAKPVPRILAIGDSYMAWHRGVEQSIADIAAKELGEPVLNHSVSGARIIYGLPISGAMGFKIGTQFRGGPYDWVIVTGGGNDFMLGCGCGACERRMERLVSKDGRKGEVPTLVAKIRQSGARVVFLGYLRSPGFGSPIENCKDEGDIYDARLKALSKRDKGVFFLPQAKLVPKGDLSFHSADRIHPSRKASKLIGEEIARLIRKVDRSR
ncbi:SGNH/GDSL hydrolase family protein [Lentibacter algarum]|uniref:SGNH/GDSL hydrolase family protein n=1 Tax=Lentibacter algarum TaxID=576131 RepID=UPI001C06C3F4|nr:SGNH/GDSL hydrolase family protein [Lentibacter algarum]MBU2981314.1 SGNH/GDSL hydrolase family protein [Lentibacter algarum]